MGTLFGSRHRCKATAASSPWSARMHLDVVDDLLQLGQIGLEEVGVTTLVLDLRVTFMDSARHRDDRSLRNIAIEHGQKL